MNGRRLGNTKSNRSSHNLKPYNLAITEGKPTKKQGSIKGGIEKSRRGTWKLTRDSQNFSVTQFKSLSIESGKRLFLVKPLTGKTHQIRVVLKSLASPILGDSLYAGAEAERVYLHAWQLSFTLGDEVFRFSCWPEQGAAWPNNEGELPEDWLRPDELSWPKA